MRLDITDFLRSDGQKHVIIATSNQSTNTSHDLFLREHGTNIFMETKTIEHDLRGKGVQKIFPFSPPFFFEIFRREWAKSTVKPTGQCPMSPI